MSARKSDRRPAHVSIEERRSIALVAEQATLSAMLMDAEAIAVARAMLTADHFGDSRHAQLFEGLLTLHDRGEQPDPVTLAAELAAQGQLEAAGGKEYIAFVLDAAPTAANIAYHAGLVAEAGARALAIRELENGAHLLHAGEPMRDIVDGLLRTLPTIAEPGGRARPQLTCMADVTPEAVDWLWPGYLPFGKLCLVEGHPGVGKSHLTLELAAHVSTGTPLPDGTRIAAADVVLLTAEDGLGDTVRPRLEAAGANLHRVHVLADVPSADGPRLPAVPDDLAYIRSAIVEREARLLIVDPLTAFLSGEVNSYKDHDVRRALAPLARLAAETGCLVVVVRHLTKATAGSAITAGGGSIGIIGAARAALLVARDPQDAERVIMAVVKQNLGRAGPSLAYRLQQTASGWARVAWEGTSRHSADSLIEASRDTEERDETERCMDWLEQYLSGGGCPVDEVKKAGQAARFSMRTIERAKQRLGATHRREGFGKGATYFWELPHARQIPTIGEQGEHGASTGPNPLQDNAPTSSPRLASMHGEHAGDYVSDEVGIALYAQQHGGEAA